MPSQATTVSSKATLSGNPNVSLSRQQRMARWARHHRRESREAINKLMARPVQTLMLSCLIGVSLCLPFFFGWLVESLTHTGLTQEVREPTLSVYLHNRAPQSAIEELEGRVRLRPDVASVVLIPPEQGLAELKEAIGLNEILSSMDDNPLPYVLEVRWQPSKVSSLQWVPQARALMEFLRQQPIVASVSFDTLWLERLRSLSSLAKGITFILGVLFCLGAILAIFNGIQLMIEQGRSDIQIAQWVGASPAFVRRPFLYVGGLLGCLGGVLSSFILLGVFTHLTGAINHLLASYEIEFQIQGFPATWCFSLILLAMALGWLGARLAVNRALR